MESKVQDRLLKKKTATWFRELLRKARSSRGAGPICRESVGMQNLMKHSYPSPNSQVNDTVGLVFSGVVLTWLSCIDGVKGPMIL
jgi:hypothetical protein